jgi:hypothetical protein
MPQDQANLCYQSDAAEGDGPVDAKLAMHGMKGAGIHGYLGGFEGLPPHSPDSAQFLPLVHALCLALARSGRAEAYRRLLMSSRLPDVSECHGTAGVVRD